MEQNIVMKDVKERLSRAERNVLRDVPINRAPKSTVLAFRKLSDEEYCGDHGLCLKYLVDLHLGLRPHGLDGVFEELELLNRNMALLAGEIERLKNPVKPDKKKRIDGS